jgi:hypothetical protein
MITEAEYDRVQTLLGRNGNPRPQSHREFAFIGLIRCGDCGRMVTAEEKHQVMCSNCKFKFAYRRRDACPRCETPIGKMTQPLFLHYIYYHCSKSRRPLCSQKCVTGLELEKQISENLALISISQQFKDCATKHLHELHAKESTTQITIIETQQKAYQACVQEIDNLVKLKTSPGNADGSRLSDEEYGQRRGKLLKEKAALEKLLNDADNRAEQPLKLSEQTFEFAHIVQERFAKGDPKTKKEMLTTVASNLILKDKKLLIEARKPFVILGNTLSPANPVIQPIEPEKTEVAQWQNVPSSVVSPYLRGQRDDVRTLMRKVQHAAALIYAHFKKEFESGSKSDDRFMFLGHDQSVKDQRN